MLERVLKDHGIHDYSVELNGGERSLLDVEPLFGGQRAGTRGRFDSTYPPAALNQRPSEFAATTADLEQLTGR
jgi:hypothetical protein